MPSREPRAAGAIIALLTVAGAFVGTMASQPTLGVIGGLAAGSLIALALWWRDRRR